MRTRSPSAGRVAGRAVASKPVAGRAYRLLLSVGSVLVPLVLGIGALGLAAPAAGQGLRYTRPIEVPAPGWVRVPLAPEILREAAPAGGSLRLFGPEGEEVPFRRVLSEAGGEWIGTEVVSQVRAPIGWLVELGVSEPGGSATGQGGAVRHDRLRLELDGIAGWAAPGSIRLEGSDDGATWRLLTVGRLARLERSERPSGTGGAASVELAYPATAARFLRLSSLGAVGTSAGGDGGAAPPVRSASVETVPARSLGVTVPRPECRSALSAGRQGDESRGDGAGADGDPKASAGAPADQADRSGRSVGPRTICTLPVASAGRHLRRLDLVVTGQDRVGFRLLVPEDGRWEPVADGVWSSPVAETPHSLGLDLDLPRPPEPLRLELYGDGETAPGLARADAELAGEALVFRARRAGRHTLAYGAGVFRGPHAEEVRLPAGVEPRRIEPGPEDEGSAPTASAPLPESAGPAPSVQFARRWSVEAESPASGELYRLPLAAEVYAVVRPDLGDLRLIAAGSQVPYVRWRPAEPVTVTAVRGALPSPSDTDSAGKGSSGRGASTLRVGIDLDTPGLPLSALVVHAAPSPAPGSSGSAAGGVIRRRVRVVAVEPPSAGGDAVRRPLSPWLDWSCTPRPPLSCRLAVALAAEPASGPRRSGRLELEIAPGPDREPSMGLQRGVDLELWRRQDLLLFPWPSGDAPLRLTAGAPDLEAPDYGLADRRDELLARPSRRAAMVAPSRDGRGGRGGWLAGWTVGLTLAVALAVLLFLLDRILAEREPAAPSGPPSDPTSDEHAGAR